MECVHCSYGWLECVYDSINSLWTKFFGGDNDLHRPTVVAVLCVIFFCLGSTVYLEVPAGLSSGNYFCIHG